MRKIKSIIYLSLLIVFSVNAQQPHNLDQKEAFTLGFPQFYIFRGESNKKTHVDYEAWENEVKYSNGVIRKLLNEEIKINPNSTNWINDYVEKNPTKLMLLHLNGEARHVIRDPEMWKKFFPGHWLYEEGSVLKNNITKNDKTIEVETIFPFVKRTYRGGNGEGSNFTKNDIPNYLLLVKTDKNGNRLWYNSEIVQINDIDIEAKKLTIQRGICKTVPISFEAGKTYVAPILGGVWGGDLMFFYNMSVDCPKDKNGKTASDLRVDEIAQEFSKKGILKNINGIAFDVNYFDVSFRFPTSDTNNDGKKDGGWVNNKNNWEIGDYLFLKNIRKRMGDNFIITSDGQHPENQQAVGVLNGIESEGLVQHNDGWRGFSRTVNTHQYWEHNNNTKYKFRYVVLKLMNKADESDKFRLQRFAIGTACCLQAFTTEPLVREINNNVPSGRNILPKWMTTSGALGQTTGELLHYAKQFPEILQKTANDLIGLISSDDCNLNMVNGNIEISPKVIIKDSKDMTISLKNIELPTGDLTIFIEAKSIETAYGFNFADRVPRFMWLSLTNLSDYGEGNKSNIMYNNLSGLFGTNRMEEMSFYFRRNDISAKTADINIKIHGTEKLIINSIKIYNKPDIIIRKFEHGTVIVNPSLTDQQVNLSAVGFNNQVINVSSKDVEFVK